jgi:hypothetical protein
MEHKRDSRLNRPKYPDQYEQPAAVTATDYNYDQSYNQTHEYDNGADQYSQPAPAQEGYDQQTYEQQPAQEEDSQQPSLSDYNSHEVCVRITSKK